VGEHMSLSQLQQEADRCWKKMNCWQAKKADKLNFSKSSAAGGVFLTGATGFLGAFLLQALLQQLPTAKVYCLIRAHNAVEAQQKLRSSLKKYLSSAEINYGRIVPVMGDLTKPLLGMSEEQFQLVAHSVGTIYHSGANVNMFYPYAALKSANVSGTLEVIRLAATGSSKILHYISTLDVLESLIKMGGDVFYEKDSIAQGDGIAGGYAQSKWIAEQLVQRAALGGLPVCIYRPGMVSGHSQQGDSNTNDVLCRFIKSLIQLQVAPDLAMRVDMTPVDYVSKAIARLSSSPKAIGKVFHVVNPQPIGLNDMVATLQARGYAIAQIDYSKWLHQLYTRPNELSALAAFTAQATPEEQQTCLELWLGGHYIFDCTHTKRRLKGELINCPPADSKLLNSYLDYFVQKGFIPEATAGPALFTAQLTY
ncbi:MAG: thioester reductase domain-containing protein, partial [Phormidesmis sp.]